MSPVLLKGVKSPKRITQNEAIQKMQQMAGAMAAMRQHINGQNLVLGVLLDRMGGEAKITQAEMVDADGWKIRQGYHPGIAPNGPDSLGFWVFKLELTEEQQQEKRLASLSAEEYAALVRAQENAQADGAGA